VEVTEIETLAAHMRATGMGELELRHAGSQLRLFREGSAAQIERDDAGAHAPAHEHIVRAPAVGTFVVNYPMTSVPLAARGAQVKRGDVVALIACAGFLREVIVDVDGFVRDVLARDATLVEYGQSLLAINIKVSE
jgi:biotin carboxyl carrier protein